MSIGILKTLLSSSFFFYLVLKPKEAYITLLPTTARLLSKIGTLNCYSCHLEEQNFFLEPPLTDHLHNALNLVVMWLIANTLHTECHQLTHLPLLRFTLIGALMPFSHALST